MSYASAKEIDLDKVPIIDITPLRDGSDPHKVAQELYKASTGLGFIYIKGHGIPESKINSLRNDGLKFFRAEQELKTEISVSDKPDLKESFIWGFEDKLQNIEDHPVRGPNQWPSFLPSLQNNALSYFHEADVLAKTLLKGFALGLNLKEDFFIKNSSHPLSRASLVYYPDQPKKLGEDQFGVSAHTDFGVLTVLCQDSVGGLQIQDLGGEWFHAPPIEGTIIVNVADLLSRWTDGLYKSTPHRVVNQSGKERMSIVLAFDPNPETMVESIENFINQDELIELMKKNGF